MAQDHLSTLPSSAGNIMQSMCSAEDYLERASDLEVNVDMAWRLLFRIPRLIPLRHIDNT